MRVVRTVVIALLFIAAVFLASANMQTASLVLLPEVPGTGWPQIQSPDLPLFIWILGSLALGVVVGAFGALVEQARLRRGLRRSEKEKAKLSAELGQVQEELDRCRRECDDVRGQLEQLRAEQAASAADDGATASEAAPEETPAASAGES